MSEYKDGIYEGDYGITYFVKDNRIILTHLGQTYRSTKHFVFGDYVSPLQPMMIEKFDEAYNNSQNW